MTTMNSRFRSYLLTSILLTLLSTVCAQTTNTTNTTDFTCVVLLYEGNGCNETDIPLMEQVISKLFLGEIPGMKTVYFRDNIGQKEDVYSVSTTSKTYSYSGHRQLPNVCKIPGFCDTSPKVCAIAGCPNGSGGRRRGLRARIPERRLGYFDLGFLTLRGTMMIRKIPTTNPDCRPRELGFRCDFV